MISAVIICVAFLSAALIVYFITLQNSRKNRRIIAGKFDYSAETAELLVAKRNSYAKTFFNLNISAICLASVAVLLAAGGIIITELYSDEYILIAFMLPSILLLTSVFALIEVRITFNRAFERLIMKGNYDDNALNKKYAIILSILYWIASAVVFVIGRNVTKEWYFSCIFLIFAALIYFSILIVAAIFRSKQEKNK